MMALLLNRADFTEANGIRPQSLKVTTISALMGGELSKGEKISHNWQFKGTIGQSLPKIWEKSTHEI